MTDHDLRIGIVGAGRVGTALGQQWASAGHDVRYGLRNPADPKYADLAHHGTLVPILEAASTDVVLLAVPWAAVRDVVESLGRMGETIVVDATNPLAADLRTHDRDAVRSGAEIIAEHLDGGRVVKAFNTTGSGNMVDAGYEGPAPMMPIAGDDADAKRTVSDLAAAVGFEPIDAGPLSAAQDLEHLAALWIRMAYRLGNGPNFAFAVLRR